jgi:stearoyl-CoA desaturase (delta-9 desaturase)
VINPKACSSAGSATEHNDIIYPSAIPFALMHLGCIAAFWSGVTYQSIVICWVLYWLRMFAIGAGYHRYFSHRAYKTSRVFQFLLALLAQSSSQKSVLWWAAKHRHHHFHSDTEQDIHSPRHKSFFYSHIGWIFDRRHDATDLVKVEDFARFPELMLLHKYEIVPALFLALLCFMVGGWPGLFVGFFWSTVLLYHSTFCINSLAHVHGSKRYLTGDDSRNNWLLAFFTMGEGWHNNHHAYQSSVRQGFRWWEIDVTFYTLKALSWFGLVWDLRAPPEAVRRNQQRLGSKVIDRAAVQLACSFNLDLIAGTIMEAFSGANKSGLQEKLAGAAHHATDALSSLHLPQLPTRQEILARARAMFIDTPSLEDVVDRAYFIILDKVGTRLDTRLATSMVT